MLHKCAIQIFLFQFSRDSLQITEQIFFRLNVVRSVPHVLYHRLSTNTPALHCDHQITS
jgi:hypothetical protein